MSYINSSFENIDMAIIGSFSHDLLKTQNRKGLVIGGAGLYGSLSAASTGLSVGCVGVISDSISDTDLRPIKNIIDFKGLKKFDGVNIIFDIEYDSNWNASYHIDEIEGDKRISFNDYPEAYNNAKIIHFCPTASMKNQIEFALKVKKRTNAIISATTFKNRILCQPELVSDFLKITDFFFLNAEEAIILTKCSTIEAVFPKMKELSKEKSTIIIVTLGEDGAIIFNNDECYKLNSFVVNPIDTTGAGESFAGAFIGHYLKNRNIMEAGIFAICLSSIVVEGWGAEKLFNLNHEELSNRFKKVQQAHN